MKAPRLVACADCSALRAATIPDCFCGCRGTLPAPEATNEKRST
jgi:hypothetical protein